MRQFHKLFTIISATLGINDMMAQAPNITYIGNDALAAAQYLVGPNVEIHSASFTGNQSQCATFNNGLQAIGFDEGLAITTGNSNMATYPPQIADQNCGYQLGIDCVFEIPISPASTTNDPNLNNGTDQYSMAALEFVFTAQNPTIEFEFVFASMEYPEFVGQIWNDKFAFILSKETADNEFTFIDNLARLPNGTIISINNVNNGNPSNSSYEPKNPDFFTTNNNWVYDGQTISIKIKQENIECNKKYKLKLVIANIHDNRYDSGVFFKKGSWANTTYFGPLTGPSLVCEGEPITLNVAGSDGLTYTWSTGQEGLNLKSITPDANLNITSYSVQASAPNGCVFSESVNITVHPNNNQPPYMNGINNTGVYKAYVRAGENISFQMPTFDNPAERVDFFHVTTISNAIQDKLQQFQQIGTFSWTPNENQIGEHTFLARASDQNVCYNLSSDYTFTIIVVCPYCEIGIDYNNRNPSNSPVPPLTEMAEYITAGLEGPVVLGEPTIFRAGDRIVLDEFEPGDEFLAEIVPVCDEEVCNECCEVLDGLIVPSFIPDVFSPNGDGFNDVWYVADFARPFCSFNAQYYDLEIFTRWGGESIYHVTVTSGDCCPFKSPPTPTSVTQSIFWNGKHANGNDADDGTYYYVLKLAGCGNAPDPLTGYLLLASSSSGRYADTADVETPASPTGEVREKTSNAGKLVGYPNPVKDIFTLEWLKDQPDEIETSYFIFDLMGRLIAGGLFTGADTQINTSGWAIGIYNCVVISEDTGLNSLKIVKQ